uniref:Dna2/Cas4 domain-containing protein n=1 Tax=Sulfurihydrogenibium sp. TaxID=2053621 RepID=UPI00260F57AE
MEINFEELKVNGIKVNYYYVCKRKLWLFDRRITMEDKSEKVALGLLLHQESYKNLNSKEVMIDNLISIDIVDSFNVMEVKYSDKMKQADKMQILYYLYYLKRLGIDKKGIINYPKQRNFEYKCY